MRYFFFLICLFVCLLLFLSLPESFTGQQFNIRIMYWYWDSMGCNKKSPKWEVFTLSVNQWTDMTLAGHRKAMPASKITYSDSTYCI